MCKVELSHAQVFTSSLPLRSGPPEPSFYRREKSQWGGTPKAVSRYFIAVLSGRAARQEGPAKPRPSSLSSLPKRIAIGRCFSNPPPH